MKDNIKKEELNKNDRELMHNQINPENLPPESKIK